MTNYEQLAQHAYDLDFQIKQKQYELKQIKEQIKNVVENDKHNGSVSQNIDNGFKVTVKRNMNAKLNEKELDRYISEGYTLPDGIIKTKRSVHTPTLTKKIEEQSEDLPVLASFIETNYTETVTITKKED